MRARGYAGPLPATLGYLEPHQPGRHPAMIAAFGLAEEPEPGALFPPRNVDCVHLTLLAADGNGKADVEEPKFTVAQVRARPIVLAPLNDLLGLAITEGIEDALSVHAATGLGVWAAYSAGNMPKLVSLIPDYIEALTIYAHADDAGQRGARALADALRARAIEIHIEGLSPCQKKNTRT